MQIREDLSVEALQVRVEDQQIK